MKLHPSILNPFEDNVDLGVLPIKLRLSVMFGGPLGITMVTLGFSIVAFFALLFNAQLEVWTSHHLALAHLDAFVKLSGICSGLFVAMTPALFLSPERVAKAFANPAYQYGILHPELRRAVGR